MSFWEILLVGVALSMDAFAVSAACGMNIKNIRLREMLLLAGAFGAFQGLMPLLGFYTGGAFGVFMTSFAPLIASFLLFVVGGKMIWDSFHAAAEAMTAITLPLVLLQAVATSIDALAVGVSLAAVGDVRIWPAAGIIAATTFTLSLLAAGIGRICGALLADKTGRAGLIGGAILLIIGAKMLLP